MTISNDDDAILYLCRQDVERLCLEIDSVAVLREAFALHAMQQTTTTSYLPFAWLQAGTIVVNVSLDDVMPDVVLQAQCVVVDDWFLVKNDERRLLGKMYRAGTLIGPDEEREPVAGQRKIDAQLGDLVRGIKLGRRSQQDIILVNPFGLAIEDVALAQRVYQKAQESGAGRKLPR